MQSVVGEVALSNQYRLMVTLTTKFFAGEVQFQTIVVAPSLRRH